jgi:glycosyltransferase involved in cell wall biosynthesis
MKILFFINHLADGGAERVAATLINHLSLCHKITAVTFCEKEDTFPLNKSITRRIIIANGSNKIMRAFKRIVCIRKEIKKEKPDITISFMTYTNIYTLMAKTGCKGNYIISERSSLNRNLPFLIRVIRNLTYPTATKVVFVTKADRERIKYKDKCETIYNPITTELYPEHNNRGKTITTISATNRWQIKGLDLLIKAWAKIATQNPEWNLEIYGRNNNIIPPEIQQLPQKRVSWLGWKDNIEEILRKKSIFVLTSRIEGCPNSLIEAMSQGCACIATNCAGGMKEIITDGKDGLLTESENIDDIAEKIQILIRDEDLRYKLSVGAIEKAKQFDKNIFFAKWDNLIAEVTAK